MLKIKCSRSGISWSYTHGRPLVYMMRSYGRGYSVDNLERFRLFYLTWPIEQISAMLSRKSLLEQNYPASSDIPQTMFEKTGVPASLDGLQKFQTLTEKLPIGDIVRRFPLPWSAYVRLLSVKNELARRFYEAEALRGHAEGSNRQNRLYGKRTPRGVYGEAEEKITGAVPFKNEKRNKN